MIKVKSDIKGLTPLVMDRLDVEGIIKPLPKPKQYTEEWLQATAEQAIYQNGNGLYIPNRNVKACLVEGSKMGRLTLTGRRNVWPFIKASVFIEPREISLNKEKPDNYIQFPMRRADGNVIPKRLPICVDWGLSIYILIYDEEIVEKVREALTIAGLSVGLGNQRPEYGRFEVTWKIIKSQ